MNEEIQSALNAIPVADLTYDDWLKVGMALKHEGCSVDMWDSWSMSDSRYKAGLCERKWNSFTRPLGKPVTASSIFQMAQGYGWYSDKKNNRAVNRPFGWDDEIGTGDAEKKTEYKLPESWDPAAELIKFLETLFRQDDIISYVTNDVFKDAEGKWNPRKGVYTKTAGKIIDEIKKHPDDLSYAIDSWKHECGAWIRVNPLDGAGVTNANVVDFRYVLVESDTMTLAEQDALFRRLELPIATLTYSGGKSLHALVKVDAKDYNEYRARVEYLYDYLGKQGAFIDKANRNPARLTRMPGVERGDKRQQLIDVNIGKCSWLEWVDFIEENMDDDLPETISIADSIKKPPKLPEILIDNILRCGHKMLISGASKAGKSFLLMELAIALSEGTEWLGFKCRKSRVLYINLEIDGDSCQHRFLDIYEALKIEPKHPEDIKLWNLRGFATPLNEMVPKISRKAKKVKADVIVVDPIYKVITGDENNASEMGNFCNQFDRIAKDTGCSIIYCHHHSKGAQGSKKAQDRASGSGVFARDPDAQIDMIQLDLTEDQINNLADDGATAWRMESSLREFKNFKPVNFWFEHPIHRVDTSGELDKSYAEGSAGANLSKSPKRNSKAGDLDAAYYYLAGFNNDMAVKVSEMANYLGVSEVSVRSYLKARPEDYKFENGFIFKLLDDGA